MEDNQLVGAYLIEKVAGRPLPPNCPVVEWDLYGDMEPWVIWERFRGSDPDPNPNPNEEEDLYLFSRLKESRGFWSLDGWEREIVVDGVRCGVRMMRYRKKLGFRMMRYRNKKFPENHKRWLLEECCLCDFRDSYVLCLLRKLKKKGEGCERVSEWDFVELEKRVFEMSGGLWRLKTGETTPEVMYPEIWSRRRRSSN